MPSVKPLNSFLDMSFKKLRWQATVEQFRSQAIELELVKKITKEAALPFQTYYEQFCALHNISIAELNDQHRQTLQKIYKTPEPQEGEAPLGEMPVDESLGTALSVFKGKKFVGLTETEEDDVVHEAFARLFKKIALQLHPDRLSLRDNLSETEKYRLTKLFKDAILSLEEKRYFVLIDIAAEFNIGVPDNYAVQITWMRKQINQLRKYIVHEQQTYNYLFAEAETDQERDDVIKRFLFQLFKLKVP